MLDLEFKFPAVDPADLTNVYENMSKMPVASGQTAVDPRAYAKWCKPGTNMVAIWARASILGGMHARGLLNDRIHNGTLDDVVYKVVAEFPIEPINIKLGVDGRVPFDGIVEGMLERIRLG